VPRLGRNLDGIRRSLSVGGHCPPSFGLLRASRDSHFGDLRPLQHIHDAYQLLHSERFVRANNDRCLRLFRAQGDEPALQSWEIHDLVVECDHVISINSDGLDCGRVDGLICLSAGRHLEIDTLLHEWRGDDKNNEQNECEIEQRRNVDLGERVQCLTIGKASHRNLFRNQSGPNSVVDVFMFKLGSKFRGEVIVLHNERANAGDEEIVTKHSGNGDEQTGDRGNQRT
jgi:hypothetical protein